MSNKICKFCEMEVKETDDEIKCPECGEIYHSECWDVMGGCKEHHSTTSNVQKDKANTYDENYLLGLKREKGLNDGVTESPNCNKKAENIVADCQTISSENLTIQKGGKKKLNKVNIIIISLVLLISAVIIGFVINSNIGGYEEKLKTATVTMIEGAAKAEKCGNLIQKVWYNSIFEKYDAETDKYTKNDFYGFNDFSLSLANLYVDESFRSEIEEIEKNRELVKSMMRELKDPMSKYEEEYDAICELYDAYLDLTNLVDNPTGSYKSFSDNFSNADNQVSKCYDAMSRYLDL